MKVQDLISGQYYVYSQKLGTYNEDGTLTSWTEAHKVKYLGDLTKEHPEMNISHCARYLFIVAEYTEKCGVTVRSFILPEFDVTGCITKLGEHP